MQDRAVDLEGPQDVHRGACDDRQVGQPALARGEGHGLRGQPRHAGGVRNRLRAGGRDHARRAPVHHARRVSTRAGEQGGQHRAELGVDPGPVVPMTTSCRPPARRQPPASMWSSRDPPTRTARLRRSAAAGRREDLGLPLRLSGVVVPLSVLDLVPIGSGSTATAALATAPRWSRRAEELGFRRYWVAEHHGMPGIAQLVARGADRAPGRRPRSRIRVGSGGVMLPNHQPLVVAEQFGTLDALHPGRIDLGIGRAPGTDPRTARALRRGADTLGADDFPEQLTELAGLLPRRRARCWPSRPRGSSPRCGCSGPAATARRWRGCSGSRSRSPTTSAPRTRCPRSRSTGRRSGRRRCCTQPYAMIAASVLAAETDAEARRLALPSALQFLRLRQGSPGPVPTPGGGGRVPVSRPRSGRSSRTGSAGQIIGSPDTVRDGVHELVERTGVDELMVVTSTHDGADRLRSYELLAEAVFPDTARAELASSRSTSSGANAADERQRGWSRESGTATRRTRPLHEVAERCHCGTPSRSHLPPHRVMCRSPSHRRPTPPVGPPTSAR